MSKVYLLFLLLTVVCGDVNATEPRLVPDPPPTLRATDHEVPDARTFKCRQGSGAHLTMHLVKSHTVRVLNRPITTVGRLTFFLTGTTQAWLRRADVRFRRFPILNRKASPHLTRGPDMDLTAWNKQLDRTILSERMPGRLDFLIGGPAYYARLRTALGEATNSIDMQTYIFDNDDVARDMANLLKRRSEEVEVRVLFDGLGTFMAQRAAAPTLPATYRAPPCMESYLQEGPVREGFRRIPRNAGAGDDHPGRPRT